MPIKHPTDSREANEARITALYNRLSRTPSGSKRADMREEIDRLLEEHHERWPGPELVVV